MNKLYFETPYGLLPKSVMKDVDLPPYSKLIFAYLCAYAGNKDSSFPSRELITHELGISKDTFSKYMNVLKDFGYITVKQDKSQRGKFGHNVYYLNAERKTPCPISPDTVSPDTVSPDTVSPDTVSPDTVRPDTNSNNINNNNINNNSINNNNNNNRLLSLYQLYEQLGFGLINPITKEDIEIMAKEYTVQWVEEAMKEANESGVRNLKYVKGILKNWKIRGYRAERGGNNYGPTRKSNENNKSEKPKYNFNF